MKKFIIGFLLMVSGLALSGFLQNEDFKSQSELESLGGNVSQLLNDTKIYLTADGLNKRLDQAITDGDLAGGAGNDLNIASDPSFEKGAAPGTCTNCTIDYQTTGVHLLSETNTQFARMNFGVSSTGDYTDTYTIDSSFNNKDAFLRIAIRTSRTDVNLEIYSNSNLKFQRPVLSDGIWHMYEIPFITESTDIEFKIDATTASTTAIDMDLINFGALPDGYIGNISQASFVGRLDFTASGTNDSDCAHVPTVTNNWSTPDQTNCDSLGVIDPDSTGVSFTTSNLFPALTVETEVGVRYKVEYNSSIHRLSSSSGVTCSDGISLDGGTTGYIAGLLSETPAGGSEAQRSLGTKTYDFTATSTSTTINYVVQTSASSGCEFMNRLSNFSLSIYKIPTGSDKIVRQRTLLDATTANDFSAKVTTAGVVTSENHDFINGNCSNIGTGTYECTYNASIFTQAPAVVCSAVNTSSTSGRLCEVVATTSTSAIIYLESITGAGHAGRQNGDFEIVVSKQGVDVAKGIEVAGVFRGENIKNGTMTPGTEAGKAKVCSFDVTGATTCSNIIGDCITSCANTGTGAFTVTWNTDYWSGGSYNCGSTAVNGNVFARIITRSSATMTAEIRTSGTALINSNASFVCHGVGP